MLPSGLMKNAVRTTNGRMLEGWARTRTEGGLLYYLNHEHGITQWDHPEYIRIFDEMLPINTVKYAAYRTACKLRHLQTRFKFHEVSLQCVTSAFDCAGLRAPENSDVVPIKEIERVILYIYRTTFKNKPVDSSLCTDLMMNLILNTYDENRSGNLQVLKCKMLLIVMCGGRLQEKYRYLFNQIADHNNCCTRRRLAKLLQNLASITELLSEQLSFGISLVPAAVDSCFKEIEGDIGITEDCFLTWLMQEPQTLVWWTTLYRLSSAELVCHDVKCGACKQRPIIGLRYQCLKCLGYNLCQDCFLHGRKSRNHKLSHPIQEYCHELRAIGVDMRNVIFQQAGTISYYAVTVCTFLDGTFTRCWIGRGVPIAWPPQSPYLTFWDFYLRKSLLQDTNSEVDYSHPLQNQRKWMAEPVHGVEESSSDEGELMMSRTICQSLEDLDKLDGDNVDLSSSSSASEGNSQTVPEPLILPTSPRQQIHSVIKHLEDGQRQLSNRLDMNSKPSPIPSQLVEEHTAELQTQINKLKTILHHCSKYSKYQKNMPESGRALPRMESTPIVGERGLHLSLSPIGTENNHNDTAVLDNKENHYTETRHYRGLVSSTIHSNCNIDTYKERITLSTISGSEQNTLSFKENNPNEKRYKRGGKLPSFTEIDSSDLTSSSKITLPSSDKDVNEPEVVTEGGVLNVLKEETEEDSEIAEVKEELEKILLHLEEIFPYVANDEGKSPIPKGVITAACEIGDAMANYVERIPFNHNGNNNDQNTSL